MENTESSSFSAGISSSASSEIFSSCEEAGESSSCCKVFSSEELSLWAGARTSAAISSSVASGMSLIEKFNEYCLSCVRMFASLLSISESAEMPVFGDSIFSSTASVIEESSSLVFVFLGEARISALSSSSVASGISLIENDAPEFLSFSIISAMRAARNSSLDIETEVSFLSSLDIALSCLFIMFSLSESPLFFEVSTDSTISLSSSESSKSIMELFTSSSTFNFAASEKRLVILNTSISPPADFLNNVSPSGFV